MNADGDGKETNAIHVRKGRLKQILSGKEKRGKDVSTMKENSFDLDGDSLLDAFLVLYDEVKGRKSKENSLKYFLNKFEYLTSDLRKLRINSGDFLLGDVIGEGKFGQVRIAKEKSSGRNFAAKIFDKFNETVQKYLNFIENELTILLQSNSPWICHFTYSFQDTKKLYFVTEYLPGGDFRSLLQKHDGKLEEEMAKFYLAELALAINAVHALGFVHRDIKPENIMLDGMGHLKLIDFGSSTRICKGKAVSSAPLGLITYVAPEVLLSIEDDPDKELKPNYGIECDFWSLGVIAYESVFGTVPFNGDSNYGVYNSIVTFKTSVTYPTNTNISQDMIEFISGLIKDKEERLDYSAILRHSFFYSVIWDGLRDEISPYIPHFGDENTKYTFSEKVLLKDDGLDTPIRNAPFVGFTKTFQYAELMSMGKGNTTGLSNGSFLDLNNSSMVDDKDEALIKLRMELNAKNSVLLDRMGEVKELKDKLEETNDLICGKEQKIATLEIDMKRLELERESLERKLAEEREGRNDVEDQSQSLIKDIKTAQKKKLSDLQNEIELQKGLVKEKEAQVSALNTAMTDLRSEMKKVQSELRIAQRSNGEHQTKVSRSFRGSISIMESQLHKSSSELENRISELNLKHFDEVTKLRGEHQASENKMKNLLEEKDGEIFDLKGRLDEARQARDATLEEINKKINKFAKNKKDAESHMSQILSENEQLKKERDLVINKKTEEIEVQLERKTAEVNELRMRLEQLQKEDIEKDNKNKALEENIVRLEVTVTQVEEQKRELTDRTKDVLAKGREFDVQQGAVQILQEQLEKSQNNLDSLKETLLEYKQKVKEAEKNLYQTEKQFSDTKLDLRILTREKKEADDKISLMNEMARESSRKNYDLQETISAQERKITQLESDIGEVKEKLEQNEFVKNEREMSLKEKASFASTLEVELTRINTEMNGYKERLNEYETLRVSLDQREALLKEKDIRLDEKERKIENLVISISLLKEACSALESQLSDIEVLLTQKSQELESESKGRYDAEMCIGGLRDELRRTRGELNEMKSLRLFAEKKYEDVESTLKTVEVLKTSESNILHDQISQLKSKVSDLTNQLAHTESRLEEAEIAKAFSLQTIEAMKHENKNFKDESCKLIPQLVKLKEHNIKLNASLTEEIQKCETLTQKVSELKEEMRFLEEEKDESETRLQETLNQQVKLIEYLQTQNEALSKRKVTLVEKIFGRERDTPIGPPPPMTPNGRTMETKKSATLQTPTPRRIAQEHKAVKNLEEEAIGLKNQLAVLQTKKELRIYNNDIPQTPKKEECVLLKKKEGKSDRGNNRISHNIPHRLNEKINMKVNKCWKCLSPIYFGRQAFACNACPAIFHSKCTTKVSNSCGLPLDVAIEMEKKGYSTGSLASFAHFTDDEGDDEVPEGWVKVFIGGHWEKRYVRLNDGKLQFYTNKEVVCDPVQVFTLTKKTKVEPRMSEKRCEWDKFIAEADMPYVLKVWNPQPNVKGKVWPDEVIYLLAMTQEQKRHWAHVILKNIPKNKSADETISDEKNDIKKAVVYSIEGKDRKEINCVKHLLADLYLFGCEEGLFSRRASKGAYEMVKIDGIGSVSQIEFIPKIGFAIMIEGKERRVVIVHLSVLRACAEAAACSKPKVRVEPLDTQNNCHLIEVVTNGPTGEVTIVVASQNHLSVYTWHKESFVRRKHYKTSETVTCLHQTPNSIIFGCDKIFELDLKNYTIEEFIDESDESLYYVMMSCRDFASYPLAILDVGMSNLEGTQVRYRPEFLICFPDIAVFVDAFGRRTRPEDIIWSKLPLAVCYRHPNLYIIHFASVEVVRLNAKSYTVTRVGVTKDCVGEEISFIPESRFIPLPSPRLYGYGALPTSIVVGSIEKTKTEVIDMCLEEEKREVHNSSNASSFDITFSAAETETESEQGKTSDTSTY